MPFTLTMPKLSPTMEKGTIAKWHKAEGDFVAAGDLLAEISSDKATIEHNALDEGWLRKVLIADGDEAVVNQPIAIFTEEENESIDGYHVKGTAADSTPKMDDSTAATPAASVKGPIAHNIDSPNAPNKRILASPLAKKLAAQQGLNLSGIKGSGPGGRIMKKDLEAASSKEGVQFKKAMLENELPAGSFEEIKLMPIRQIVAQRLQEAKATIPHFYVQQTIDAESLIAVREQLKAHGIKVTFNDLILKASALALKRHPKINCGFNASKNTLLLFKTIDISVAVSIDEGLITPIVNHADKKSILDLSDEVKSLSKKAKEGKLQPQEFQGGSFTISNLGMYGVANFQAIINPPQAAILAISAIKDQPIVKKGMVVPGKVLNLSLSVDHRAIDGALAAEFMLTLKNLLESPAILLIG